MSNENIDSKFMITLRIKLPW